MKITGLTVLRNATMMGYPWVESILAVLPICDVFHVGEGFSEDDTWKVLRQLRNRYPQIELSRYQWQQMDTGFAIGDATNAALKLVRRHGGKVLYVQADELWHPDNLLELKRLANEEYDAYIFPYLHLEHNCQVVQEGAGYHWAIRMVANKPEIISHRDAWTFEGYSKALEVHSLAHPVVHCNYCFWDNVPVKKRVQADVFYQDLPYYKVAAEQAEERYGGEVPELFARKESPFAEHLTPLMWDMIGERKYYVRERLLQ
jgi:hypothetical protein